MLARAGKGAVFPGYAGSERAAGQRTRAAYSGQISQRHAAGMRCAAGQLTELRAHCAADEERGLDLAEPDRVLFRFSSTARSGYLSG